jgi:AraC-like DNA-binding protein
MKRPPIRRVREILHARFAEQVSLQELADAAGLSQFYLLRVFGHSLGVPPHQYQTHLRLAHARAHLRRGARVAGGGSRRFADQSHFVRAFRRLHSLTPGMFFAHSNVSLPHGLRMA